MLLRYNPEKHHRRSVRLRHYDYAQPGAYFVTICAWQRECVFGIINDGTMKLNEYGVIVQNYLDQISGHFPNVEIDLHIIMPNHVHGIIVINNCRGEVPSPLIATPIITQPLSNMHKPSKKGGETPPLRRPSLGHIVAYFKYQTTKHINRTRNTPGMPVWQRNYHDRVIRNEKELQEIRQYIRHNPLQWDRDDENPVNV